MQDMEKEFNKDIEILKKNLSWNFGNKNLNKSSKKCRRLDQLEDRISELEDKVGELESSEKIKKNKN
jgi:TolA-binding protein